MMKEIFIQKKKLTLHTLNFVLIPEEKKNPVPLRRIYSQAKQNYTRSIDISDFYIHLILSIQKFYLRAYFVFQLYLCESKIQCL